MGELGVCEEVLLYTPERVNLFSQWTYLTQTHIQYHTVVAQFALQMCPLLIYFFYEEQPRLAAAT